MLLYICDQIQYVFFPKVLVYNAMVGIVQWRQPLKVGKVFKNILFTGQWSHYFLSNLEKITLICVT